MIVSKKLEHKNPQRCHLLVLCLISLPFLRPPGVFQYSHAAPVFDQTNLMCVQLLSDAKFQYYKEENESTLRITQKLSVAKITGIKVFWSNIFEGIWVSQEHFSVASQKNLTMQNDAYKRKTKQQRQKQIHDFVKFYNIRGSHKESLNKNCA